MGAIHTRYMAKLMQSGFKKTKPCTKPCSFSKFTRANWFHFPKDDTPLPILNVFLQGLLRNNRFVKLGSFLQCVSLGLCDPVLPKKAL